MNTKQFQGELSDLAELAQLAAKASAEIILSHFQTSLDVHKKADGSPVTIADKKAEECIVKLIRKHRPNDGWLGEEFGSEQGTSGYQWIIDPIDGTVAFVHGVPLFGTLLAVQKDDRTLLGLINMPALAETVLGVKGAGTFHNGQRCQVSQTAQLAQATVLTTSFTTLVQYGREEAFGKLVANANEVRTWGDCYGYVLLATGRAEIMVDPVVAPWDIAPMEPIITEAGGKITDLNGKNPSPLKHVLAGNGILHEQALTAFAK